MLWSSVLVWINHCLYYSTYITVSIVQELEFSNAALHCFLTKCFFFFKLNEKKDNHSSDEISPACSPMFFRTFNLLKNYVVFPLVPKPFPNPTLLFQKRIQTTRDKWNVRMTGMKWDTNRKRQQQQQQQQVWLLADQMSIISIGEICRMLFCQDVQAAVLLCISFAGINGMHVCM